MLATIKIKDNGSSYSVRVDVNKEEFGRCGFIGPALQFFGNRTWKRFSWPKSRCYPGVTPREHAIDRARGLAGKVFYRPILEMSEIEVIDV